MLTRDSIAEKLKTYGCRMTKQRSVILDIIVEEQEFCCKEIYFKVQKRDKNIGSATVYRMINTLEEVGVIERRSSYKLAKEYVE